MSFIVNGNELPESMDWRISTRRPASAEHKELTVEKDGSMRQVLLYDDGTVVETILGTNGTVMMTINREVAIDHARGLIIVLEPGARVAYENDGAVKIIPSA
ncbi:MAG: hypothetical protein AB1327_08705 [Bacillota bacterium]